jgi:DNA-directed RNA polymerase subunit RPC12/RpoP
LHDTKRKKRNHQMRFLCLNPDCGRMFGWTAKKIVTKQNVTFEYVVCPYCGSLEFDELPPNYKPEPQKIPPVQMPTPATKSLTQFNPELLLDHEWKGKKIPNTNPQQYVNKGKLPIFGWDYANNLSPAAVAFLESCENKTHLIDKFQFVLDGKLVKMQTVKQK